MSYELALKERYAEARGRLGMPMARPTTVRRPIAAIEPPKPQFMASHPARQFFVFSCFDMSDEPDAEPPAIVDRMPHWKVILREVAFKHRTTVEALQGSLRDAPTVIARQEAVYRMREECAFSWKQIGLRLGGKDHTSAMWAYRRHAHFVLTGEHSVKRFRSGLPGAFWTRAKIQEAEYLRGKGLKFKEIASIIGAASAEAVSSRLLREAEMRAGEKRARKSS